MTINPCCIPLKTGVRMITHLSMALALCVGWTALRLISISSEVSSSNFSDDDGSLRSTTGIIRNGLPPPPPAQAHPPPPPPVSQYHPQNYPWFRDNFPSPPFYNNAHNSYGSELSSHQVLYPPPSGGDPYPFRIPYEYSLYHNWHQKQQQQQQQNQHNNNHNNFNNQQEEGGTDDTFLSWYHQQYHMPPPPLPPLSGSGRGLAAPVPPFQPFNSLQPGEGGLTDRRSEENEDERERIFRTVLRQRKNFKGETTTSSIESSFTPEDELIPNRERKPLETGQEILRRNGSGGESSIDNVGNLERAPKDVTTPASSTTQQLRHHQGIEMGIEESTTTSLFYPAKTEAVITRSLLQLEQQQNEQEDKAGHGPNRKRRMMMTMKMKRLSSPRSLRNDDEYEDGYDSEVGGSKKRHDFKQQYAKVLLVCGLLALCTVVFQFLTSFLLLCFVDKQCSSAAQIWSAVNCSVIFCLATCLVLFLCEGLSMAKYSFDERLYLSLVTLDSFFSIYFLWVVMAFI